MSKILEKLGEEGFLEAMEANFTEEMASFGRGLPGAILHEDEEVLWFYTGRRHLNGVLQARFRTEEKVAIDRRIREIMAFFQSKHVAMGWAVGATSRPADLGRYLEAHGMKKSGETPGMAVEIEAAEREKEEIPGFVIREAESNEDLEPLCEIEKQGFGSSEETAQNYYETYCNVGFGPGTEWRHLIGWLHGQAVASCSLLLYAGVAGIYGVATLPEARGRGIAREMTKKALRVAEEAGYKIAVLSPSEMSERIYTRLGFQRYGNLEHYGWQHE